MASSDVTPAPDRLEALVAAEAIRNLKCRYFRCVDTHDWAGLSELFCADAIFDTRRMIEGDDGPAPIGRLAEGREAILAFISEGMAGSLSFHACQGHDVTIDTATEAQGIVAMEDRVIWGDPPFASVHGFGHYHERYRLEDGAWRIWRSKLTRLPLTRHSGTGQLQKDRFGFES